VDPGDRHRRRPRRIPAGPAVRGHQSDLAAQIHRLLHEQLAWSTYAGVSINRITTRVRPHRVPYDNPDLRRYESSYSFVVHPI